MTPTPEDLSAKLGELADFIDHERYDECMEIKETPHGKLLRAAAQALREQGGRIATLVTALEPFAEEAATDEQIKHMVGRFLCWKLPEDFNPDGGVSFKPFMNAITGRPYEGMPVGTNLFTAVQAEAMVRHMIEGMPEPSQALREQGERVGWKCKADPHAVEPQDCDWPNCGCDPHADRVMHGLREQGWETGYDAHQLHKRIRELEEALKPFAEEAATYDCDEDEDDKTLIPDTKRLRLEEGDGTLSESLLNVGDLRRARRALQQGGE